VISSYGDYRSVYTRPAAEHNLEREYQMMCQGQVGQRLMFSLRSHAIFDEVIDEVRWAMQIFSYGQRLWRGFLSLTRPGSRFA
jgi:hypothetical protein